MNINDLKQDTSNPNKGNAKGRELIEKSLKEFGAGRSILTDKDGNIVAGNNVHKAAMKAGMKIKVIETSGDELVVVQRNDLDINSEKGRELSLVDNLTAKTNITFNKDLIAKEFKKTQLQKWGLQVKPKPIKSTPLKWFPDTTYKSSNMYDIPDLNPDLTAPLGISFPFVPWGTIKRGSDAPSIHFYVDDYRFQTIYDKPDQVLQSGCRVICEPNFSTTDDMPFVYGAFLVFKKRWFSRMMQEHGVGVYVDLHVTDKFREINVIGVPPGWSSFSTRGYADDTDNLLKDIAQARQIAGTDQINMIVYGGGKECQDIALDHGCTYLKPFTAKHKKNG